MDPTLPTAEAPAQATAAAAETVAAAADTAAAAVNTAAPVADTAVEALANTAETAVNLADSGQGMAISAEQLLQNNEALALTKMGFAHLLQASDMIGLTVLAIMAVMSVLTWYYIFYNAFRMFAVTLRTAKVQRAFWDANAPSDAMQAMENEPAYEPFSKIALSAVDAASHHADAQGGRMAEALSRQEFIDRAINQAATRESAKFDSGLTMLATVGSTAPFVGLFGTVWGIYHALIGISARGKASLDVVAGPVGEALIMTCIGLGVAIPAVLAYNYFVRANGRLRGQIETFKKDLFDYFATGERVRVTKYGARQSEPRVV
jgi:biopolymer transport protein ExbB